MSSTLGEGLARGHRWGHRVGVAFIGALITTAGTYAREAAPTASVGSIFYAAGPPGTASMVFGAFIFILGVLVAMDKIKLPRMG